ncbi:MAG: HypC/HybG/HupF family hydrogenase formation chaperone [Lachnospiraceae bacterium]|nr:HypC/HybG/HupF family hydrogenase formation chaperone [Lachnospiraceae bacterium]
MCVALPGIVEKIEDNNVIVDFSGNKVRAFGGFCKLAPGDRVLVHAGCVLQVVSQSEAEELESILKDIDVIGGGTPVRDVRSFADEAAGAVL